MHFFIALEKPQEGDDVILVLFISFLLRMFNEGVVCQQTLHVSGA